MGGYGGYGMGGYGGYGMSGGYGRSGYGGVSNSIVYRISHPFFFPSSHTSTSSPKTKTVWWLRSKFSTYTTKLNILNEITHLLIIHLESSPCSVLIGRIRRELVSSILLVSIKHLTCSFSHTFFLSLSNFQGYGGVSTSWL